MHGRPPKERNLRYPSVKAPKPEVTTAHVRHLARCYTEDAVKTLVELMGKAETEQVRLAAAVYLINRGWGVPPRPKDPDAGMDEGDANTIKVIIRDLAREHVDEDVLTIDYAALTEIRKPHA